ncbi:hypothetical protein [Lysobacter sp.]|uniref:hypothetical protein n=1 Tax=Lysobacter sp. TaxID=72226 RepID=UPI002D338716|nr:hypothetical protein [Lysobacter sp.]HZX76636.1 hypothetical protein [Lysobacter sp.]
MNRPLLFCAIALSLVLSPLVAFAQQAYVNIEQRLTPEQLRSVGLTSAQLEQLNRLLREAQEKEAVAAPIVAAAPAVASATTTGNATPQPSRDAGRDDRSSLVGFNDEPIHSRLKGTISQWEPGTVFELENGQQWKVLKGYMKLPKALESPEIVVVPGVAGRWFLQVHEDAPKARVYRID